MQTMLDELVSKVSDIYCHVDEGCYVTTCALNCAIFSLRDHLEHKNHMMIFGYIKLLEKMSKQVNPVEAH